MIESPRNVLRVSEIGGDFDTVEAAVAEAAILATVDSPIQVRIAPGIYEVTSQIVVAPFVHLRGSGRESTILRGEISGGLGSTDAGLILLGSRATLSDLRVENRGAGNNSVAAVAVTSDGGTATMRDVAAVADAPGSSRAIGILLIEASPEIDSCQAVANGASSFNQGLNATGEAGGPFRLRRSEIFGQGSPQGIGIFIVDGFGRIEDCTIFGGLIGVSVENTGSTRLVDCSVTTSGSNPCLAQSGNASLESKGVEFNGGNAVGSGSNLRYVHCVRSNLAPVVNGIGSSIE
ncbi:MAG: hypothetical protein AAF368_17720, partial [Planctomycetota bacterium]